VEDFGCGQVGDDGSAIEKDDAVGEVEGFVEVVGDEQDGLADAREKIAEHGLHFGAGEGIEGTEGFVHEEDCRIVGERASESNALALASGELPWITRMELGRIQTCERKDFGNAALTFLGRKPRQLQRHACVAFHAHVREEAGLLDDVADAAAELDRIGGAGGEAADANLSGGWHDEAVDHAEQRRLAAAAAAENRSDCAVRECEIDIAEDLVAGWE
jgi:hypothetical protein